MKLRNADLAGQSLSVEGGKIIQVDADGFVETDDKAVIAVLQVVGFSVAGFKKLDKAAVTEPLKKSESVPEPVKAEVEPEEIEEPEAEAKDDEAPFNPEPKPVAKSFSKGKHGKKG